MFSLTFLLLLYAKHCKRNTVGVFIPEVVPPPPPLHGRNSGVDRAIIDALPMFSFASLQGFKDGLECAVCLSRFEKADILRLLPKCKHGFHLECVDAWLDNHSTCPLCRHKVEAEDVLIVKEIFPESKRNGRGDEQQQTGSRRNSIGASSSSSARNSTDGGVERTLQLYVQRENDLLDSPDSKLERGIGNSSSRSRKDAGSGRKESLLVEDSLAQQEEEALARRFGHRIIVSDVVFQHRWSDFVPSDALFLNCHTLLGHTERLSNAAPRLSFSTPNSNNQPPRLSASTSLIEPLRFSASARIDPSRLSSKLSFDPPRMSSSIPTSAGLAKLNLPRSYSSGIERSRLSLNSRNDLARASFSRNNDAASPRLSCASKIPYPRASACSTSIDDACSNISDAAGRIDLEMGGMESSAACCSTSRSRLSTIKGSRLEGEAKGLVERHALLLKKALTSGRADPDGKLLTPSYQRSLSEFSGMERFVDYQKGLPNERDEVSRRWFSIARKTLSWLTGSERSKASS